jgi:magnesium-transporting ATPase (P-type)
LVINVAAVVVSAISPFFGIEEPLKVTHLLFVNLVMDGLGAIMLGNEPALEKYMDEPPRRRDESIVSKKMMGQIVTMGLYLTIISFVYLKAPFFKNLFDNEEQHLTGYFVLFIVSALFNGFNVRDDGYGIFKGLDQNTGFLKVFFAIIIVQALIVNAGLVPLTVFKWIGEMFSCTPFGIQGWIAVILLAFTMIPVDLIRKTIVGTK